MKDSLTIALTKGRILKETLPLLESANIVPEEDIFSSRKLIFGTNQANVKLLVLRGADVTTYVRHGVADLGVSGKDMLMEYGRSGIYELLDLKISKCRLMTAGRVGEIGGEAQSLASRRTVATKFTNIARQYYAEQGINVELIKLYGAMELAPLVGLADEIVDIVDTGNTLKANGMEPRELIADISSRLIVNKAAMKVKYNQVKAVQDLISNAVNS